MKKLTAKQWASVATFVLVVVVIYFSRHELVRAWELLGKVNLWILWLLLPLQILSYYSAGAMVFSFLKQRGTLAVSGMSAARMSLELNFVNHILPSGGVSGVSYMTWRLGQYGVNSGKALLAQVVRVSMGFVAFLALMLLAVIFITFDGRINRFIILVTSGIASTIVFSLLIGFYVIKSRYRLHRAAEFITKNVNSISRQLLRRKKPLLDELRVKKFFEDLHNDYVELSKEPKVLVQPFLWGLVFTLAEIGMFWVTFWSMGILVNPAPLLIAYGLGAIAGIFFITPGGAGGFEVMMIGFLATAGISQGASVAAVLLARVLLIIGTIVTGYYFYQKALNNKQDTPRALDESAGH